MYHLTSNYIVPVLLLVLVGLFLAPGFLVGRYLTQRHGLHALYVLPVAALTGCLLGYAAFWVWIASPAVGRWFSVGLVAIAVLAGVWCLATRAGRDTVLRLDVLAPLVVLLCVVVFYHGIIFTCLGGPLEFCHVDGSDNMLPRLFAEHIAAGAPKQMFVGDWQGSDRPPLQAGILLAQDPLTRGPAFAILSTQLLGSALQALWIVGLWVVARKLRLPVERIVILVAFCVFSGFFFYNTYFVWPKLLAAALGTVAFCLLFTEERRALHWGLAAAMLGCAMLSHSSVFFTIAPMLVAALALRRYRPSLKTLGVAALVGLVVFGPWMAYQRLYDPPGDRLLKWHLAGVVEKDDRSFGQALVDGYSSTSPSTILLTRVDNLRTVVGAIPLDIERYGPDSFRVTLGGPRFVDHVRELDYRSTLFGIGLLNLGWLALLIPGVRRRIRDSGLDLGLLKLMVTVGVASVLFWVALLFVPFGAIIHQGSYFTMMLLMAAFGAMLVVLPKRVVLPVLGVQFVAFMLVWVLTVYPGHVLYQRGETWTVLGLLGIAASLVLIGRFHHVLPGEREAAPKEEPVAVGSAPGAP